MLDLSTPFLEMDVDRNGQIEMHEFAKEFDQTVVDEFYLRDINHDGVITLKEWNRHRAILNGNAKTQSREGD